MTFPPYSRLVVATLCAIATLNLSSQAQDISQAQAETGLPFRIALLSDTHITRGVAEDQPLYKGRFDVVIKSVNAAKVDLVLVAGDLTQGGKAEEFDDFRAQCAGFSAPMRCIPGNHDVGAKKIEGKPGGVTAKRVEQYEAQMGPSFWVQSFPTVRIVGINASLLGSGLPVEAKQWDFLEKTLAPPAKADSTLPTTILVLHYPPFLSTPDEAGGDYWNIEPAPRARLLELVRRGGVRAVFSGHLHRPITNQLNGVLYLTTPPVSFGLPRGKQAEGWTLVTISSTGEITSQWNPTDQ